MGTITRGPFTESQGEVEIDLGSEINYAWHEITLSCFNATSDPATGIVPGILSARVVKVGADRTETFSKTIDLSTDERSWFPTLSKAQRFFTSVSGLPANFSYEVTVNSWGTA